MSRMWRLLGLLWLLSGVLGAPEWKLEHAPSPAHKLKLGAANELYEQITNDNDDDDDYYTDSDSESSFASDYRSSAASTVPLSRTHVEQLRRVPRQLYRLGHDNRLDGIAAFDEDDYQSDQAPGVLTAQKEQEVGSPDMVQKSRRRYQVQSRNYTLEHMATQHMQRMHNEILCKLPQERIIRVSTETSKVYSPRITKLHRCDENSSCCLDSMVWTAKNKTTVELVFWVLSATAVGQRATPQVLSLTNHTECHCISRGAQRRKRSSQCQCPKHFSHFGLQHGGAPTSCRCDCHLSNTTCQRMKNGEEGFALSELRCIRLNECSPPICNYGIFNMDLGRCPRSTQSQQRHLGFG